MFWYLLFVTFEVVFPWSFVDTRCSQKQVESDPRSFFRDAPRSQAISPFGVLSDEKVL